MSGYKKPFEFAWLDGRAGIVDAQGTRVCIFSQNDNGLALLVLDFLNKQEELPDPVVGKRQLTQLLDQQHRGLLHCFARACGRPLRAAD